MTSYIACRNCAFDFALANSCWVKPGFRFCTDCYGQMKKIGQIVEDWRVKDGSEIMLWEGDPFNRRVRQDVPQNMRHPSLSFGRGGDDFS